MFKNKGFLYGLGLGLIVGASLLQLMSLVVHTSSAALPAQNTGAPTIAPLQAVSFPPAASIKPAKSAAIAPPATASPVNVDTPQSPEAPTVSPALYTVEIKKGMNSYDVSNLLFGQGIIVDKVAFETALDNRKLDRVIQYGTYRFYPKENVAQIINAITAKKSS